MVLVTLELLLGLILFFGGLTIALRRFMHAIRRFTRAIRGSQGSQRNVDRATRRVFLLNPVVGLVGALVGLALALDATVPGTATIKIKIVTPTQEFSRTAFNSIRVIIFPVRFCGDIATDRRLTGQFDDTNVCSKVVRFHALERLVRVDVYDEAGPEQKTIVQRYVRIPGYMRVGLWDKTILIQLPDEQSESG